MVAFCRKLFDGQKDPSSWLLAISASNSELLTQMFHCGTSVKGTSETLQLRVFGKLGGTDDLTLGEAQVSLRKAYSQRQGVPLQSFSSTPGFQSIFIRTGGLTLNLSPTLSESLPPPPVHVKIFSREASEAWSFCGYSC